MVGAGTVAESKIASLIEADAQVLVVAPDATPGVRSWAQENLVEWRQRGFQPDDLNGMFIVVAATSSTELHKQIFQDATRRGVLCNIVDVPELCDFYYPAVVQRGALQIAVSTSGQSPALAQRLRIELEEQFGPEYEAWLEYLGEARDWILRNANACSINWRVKRPLKRFAGSTSQQVRLTEFGNSAGRRLPTAPQYQ